MIWKWCTHGLVHGLSEAEVLSPETRRTFSTRTSPHITGNTRAILSLNSKHSNAHHVSPDKNQHQYVQPMKSPVTLGGGGRGGAGGRGKSTFRQNAFIVYSSFFVIFNPCLPCSYFVICIWYSDDCVLWSNLSCITFHFLLLFVCIFFTSPHFVLTFNPVSPLTLLLFYSTW